MTFIGLKIKKSLIITTLVLVLVSVPKHNIVLINGVVVTVDSEIHAQDGLINPSLNPTI